MKERFKANADTMNAMVTSMAAIVFALVRQLPPEKQQAFASDLARLAQNEERAGRTTTETLLLDLHRAAVSARSD